MIISLLLLLIVIISLGETNIRPKIEAKLSEKCDPKYAYQMDCMILERTLEETQLVEIPTEDTNIFQVDKSNLFPMLHKRVIQKLLEVQ